MLDVLVFEPFGDRRAQPSGDDPFDSGVDVERGADDRARKERRAVLLFGPFVALRRERQFGGRDVHRLFRGPQRCDHHAAGGQQDEEVGRDVLVEGAHEHRGVARAVGDRIGVEAGDGYADEVHQVVAGEGQRQGEGSREDRDPHDVEPHPLEYPQDERRRGPEGEERQQDVLADILRDVGGDQSRTLETLEKGEVEDARERYAAPERAPAAECGVVAEREDEPRDVHEQRAGREGEDHGDQNGGDDDHGLARVDELREVVQREGGVGRDAEQRGGHGGAQQPEYHRHGGRGRKSQRVVEVEQQHVAQHHAQEEHHDFGEGELPGIEDSAAGDLHHAARGERADQDAGGGDPEDHPARGDL